MRNKIVYYFKKRMIFYCLPSTAGKQWRSSFCAAGAQDYKHNTGSGIPRKPLCVLRASCLGQVPGGSAPSCSHACSCASEAPRCSGAAPGRMLSVVWQRLPAAARKNSRCYSFLLLSGAQLPFESHGAPCFSECLYVCLSFVMLKQPSEVSGKGIVFAI